MEMKAVSVVDRVFLVRLVSWRFGMSRLPRGRPKRIALVDWTWWGHHPMYCNHLLLAMEDLGIEVLALCPKPEEAAETARQTRQHSGNTLSHGTSSGNKTQFKKIKVPPWRFGSLRPRRIGGIHWALRHFKGVEKQIGEWSRTSGEPVEAIFYACMYDWDFDWVHVAQPFLRLPWT